MLISALTSSSSLYAASSVTKSTESSGVVTAATSSDEVSSASNVDATISTKWGFKVDENGFFGADFNKAAGIPVNVKINQTQLEMAETYTKAIGSSDDPVTALGKIWSFFSKVAGNALDSDGSMTESQILKMSKTFQSDGSLLDNPVSVQKTAAEAEALSQISGKIQGLTNTNPDVLDKAAFDTGQRSFFGSGYAGSLPDFKSEIKELYQNYVAPVDPASSVENEISVSELFGVFCMQEMPASADTHENVQNYFNFVQSGQDFKSYLTEKFGADHVKNLADGMNANFKDPDMFDNLMKEIDRHNKENYASYLSSQNTTADSILNQNDKTTTNSTLSSAYQGIKNVKLPTSGSLINIGI
ncbi:MAG: hypothetical protein AB7S65_08495 [Sulfuricurvum sp.]